MTDNDPTPDLVSLWPELAAALKPQASTGAELADKLGLPLDLGERLFSVIQAST